MLSGAPYPHLGKNPEKFILTDHVARGEHRFFPLLPSRRDSGPSVEAYRRQYWSRRLRLPRPHLRLFSSASQTRPLSLSPCRFHHAEIVSTIAPWPP